MDESQSFEHGHEVPREGSQTIPSRTVDCEVAAAVPGSAGSAPCQPRHVSYCQLPGSAQTYRAVCRP
ncbi:hypothetical protein ATSB10_08290 [Dyella thiooxydans]|uniref:Uncharacterized protein n=1 Tax=Dyella thiooxydans TaxID=445710 RepID=A0A160MY83_9GAMM|nr:hypothetical protein ATSB10_08290 [Dyella thiooxydans]